LISDTTSSQSSNFKGGFSAIGVKAKRDRNFVGFTSPQAVNIS